jgi:hypothetical protein
LKVIRKRDQKIEGQACSQENPRLETHVWYHGKVKILVSITFLDIFSYLNKNFFQMTVFKFLVLCSIKNWDRWSPHKKQWICKIIYRSLKISRKIRPWFYTIRKKVTKQRKKESRKTSEKSIWINCREIWPLWMTGSKKVWKTGKPTWKDSNYVNKNRYFINF